MFERARLTRWEPVVDSELLSEQELSALPPAPEDAFGEPFGVAHLRQYRSILHALRNGEQPPVSGADALSSLRTIAAIYAAVEGPPTKPVAAEKMWSDAL